MSRSAAALARLFLFALALTGFAVPAAAQTAQTITFGALANKTYGAVPFTVSATASSGLPVSFASLTTAVCTVSGTTVTIVAAGTCTIQASQAGDATYAPAPNVNQSFTVAKAAQTITFGALAGKTYGVAPFAVSATASSGLAVTFISTTTAVCTVSGNTVTIIAAGTCTIQAQQAGNGNYNAAPNINQSFAVAKAAQTITFAALAGKTYGNAPFTVSATASSGLAVAFASTTTAVCTVSGSTVTIIAAGTCSIKATQAGNANYLAATAVTQSFTVAKAAQTITFAALAGLRMDQSPFTVSATASSGLAVTFSSTTTAICTVAGTTVTLKAVGTCTIQAAQAGNGNYLAAPNVSQSFTVAKGNQAITFNALANKTYKDPAFTVAATASSGLAVAFSSLTTAVCTVAGTTVTLVAAGTCTIQAAQVGNANWNAATSVSQSFTVAKAAQTITFNALANKPLGTAPFAVAATASSALAVTFSSTTTAVCTMSGNTVTLVTVGTCTVQAAQAGNANYLAAPNVSQSFSVTPGAQTITFSALPPRLWGSPPFTLSATASSGLPVSFFTQTPSICSVTGALVTLLNVGTCVVEAVQNGNANYAPGYAAGSFPVIEPIQFAPAVGYASPYGTGNLAMGDFNRDGKIDVAATGQGSMAVYPGNGDGTLAAPIAASTCCSGSSDPSRIVVGDFNLDGKPDAITVTGPVGQVSINPGNGDYTFGAPSSIQQGAGAVDAVAVGDLNNDGNPDLVVLGGGFAWAYLGNGSGAFDPYSAVVFGAVMPTALALADFNGDGKLDLVAVDPVNNLYCVALGNGDGTLNPPSCIATQNAPIAIAIGDFNGDGKVDLALANGQYPSVSIYLGRGNGTFAAPTDFWTTDWPTGIQVGDFNADGRLDLALSTFAGVDVLAGAGDGTFFPAVTMSLGWPITSFALADLNGDGRADLAISADGPTALSVLVATHAVIPSSTITAQSGTPQSTTVNTPYPTLLSALVRDSGAHPVAGQQVAFIAPTGGPSGTFSGGSAQATAITSNAGIATAPAFTANAIAGAFSVIASTGSASAVFLLTNAGTSQQAPAFVSGPPTDGALGIAYNFLVIASGSPAPSISALPGALPTGLALNGSSGLINGTPSAVGTFAGMLTASNGVGSNATQAFAINIAAAAQAISFAALPGRTFGAAPFTVAATASSGLAVTFSSLTTAVCTVSGTTVTIATAGTCTIQAAQAGNASYAAAPSVNQSFVIAKASQTITFAPLLNRMLGSGTFTVNATASSGLAITFTSLTTPVCTVSGSTVTLVATGTCTLRAAQAGNGSFNAAASVNQSFTVKPAGTDQPPAISFVVPANNSTYAAPAVIPMLVNTTDPDGTISRVEFYNGATLIGTATTSPFHLAWAGVATGTYALTAKAYDDLGLATSSASISVTVNATGGVATLARRDANLQGVATAFAVGDLNGDAKPDLVVISPPSSGQIELARGDGSGNFVDWFNQTAVSLGVAPGNTTLLVDVNSDGKLDLISADQVIGVNLGNGDGTLRATVSYPLPTSATGLVAADFTADGKVDLAASLADGTVALLVGNGDGTFQPAVAIPAGVSLTSIAVGDLNGDGKLDLVVADPSDGSVKVLLGNGNGTFQAARRIVTGNYPNDWPYQVALSDFNGDSKLDIAVTNYYAPKVTVLIGYGDGTFQPPVDYPANANPFGVAVADFNGDGNIDLVVAGDWSDGSVSVLLGNGNGSFQAPLSFATAPGPVQVVVADLNGDGRPDVIVNSSQPFATVLLNVTGVTTSPPVFTNGPPPDATEGVPYTFHFTASGVPGPAFNLVSPSYPWFSVAIDGTLTGTPSGPPLTGVVRATNGVAPDATQSFTIVTRERAQTITFAPIPDLSYNAFCSGFCFMQVNPTASSGLVVSVISLTPAVCTVASDGSLTLHAEGSCTLRAEQAGDFTYAPAPPVDRTFNVGPATTLATIISPANGADFVAPAAITINATASKLGALFPTDVQFLHDGILIGDVTTPPYVVTWSNVAVGTYQLVARARFQLSLPLPDYTNYDSNPVTVVVTAAPDQPTVTLTSPAPNSSYFSPATIALAATASDPNATVVRVDFYSGAHIVGSATSPPYTATWSNVPPGIYTLSAKATSSNGVVATSSITVTVDSGIAVPAAMFDFNAPWDATGYIKDALNTYYVQHVGNVSQVASPASGGKPDTCMAASFAGGTIDGAALDVSSTPNARMSLAFWMYWNGGDGAMPFSWATQGLLLSGGNFGFTTTGTDLYGIPSTGLANGWHHVIAEFTNGSVTQNRLYLDGVAQTLSQITGTPTLANAMLSATFRIGGQLGGAANRFTGQIDEVVLFYGATSPTHAADLYASADWCGPVKVTLLEPSSGAVYYAPAAIDLVAAATSQNSRITSIVYYSGATQIGSTYPGQTFSWGNVAPGTYTLTATATDLTGATATSAPVTVNVMRIAGNSTVTIQATGTTFYTSGAVHLSASATAAPSYQIVEVSFFVDGSLWWNAFTPPYLFTTKNLAPGSHVITVQVLDDAGYVTVSAPLTITVVAGAPSLVYYYNDAAGTPFAAADQYGTLLWNETYAPYGERYSHEDTGTSNGLWYTGKPVEDATGLSYYGARWYNPTIGRFYSVDPQRFRANAPISFNRYAYGNNNPYRFVDPNGEFALDYVVLPVVAIGAAWYLTQSPQDRLKAAQGFINIISGTLDRVRGIFSESTSGDGEGKTVPNPNGRKGGQEHQDGVAEVEDDIRARGLNPETEVQVPTPGGNKERRFADVGARDAQGKLVELHQVGKQTKGGRPVSRERRAIEDMDRGSGIDTEFHPYNSPNND